MLSRTICKAVSVRTVQTVGVTEPLSDRHAHVISCRTTDCMMSERNGGTVSAPGRQGGATCCGYNFRALIDNVMVASTYRHLRIRSSCITHWSAQSHMSSTPPPPSCVSPHYPLLSPHLGTIDQRLRAWCGNHPIPCFVTRGVAVHHIEFHISTHVHSLLQVMIHTRKYHPNSWHRHSVAHHLHSLGVA